MRVLLITIASVLAVHLSPAEIALISKKEKTITPETGSAYGDINTIDFVWRLSPRQADANERRIVVQTKRWVNTDTPSLREWSAQVYPHRPKGAIRSPQPDWYKQPRISRKEFVEVVRRTQAELLRRDAAFAIRRVSVAYHIVLEHEKDLIPKLQAILAQTPGRVEFKHRGIMGKFHKAFAESDALRTTARSLGQDKLRYSRASMAGDYYTPVDPQLAKTWHEAAKLQGFALTYPPTISFTRAEGKQGRAGER